MCFINVKQYFHEQKKRPGPLLKRQEPSQITKEESLSKETENPF